MQNLALIQARQYLSLASSAGKKKLSQKPNAGFTLLELLVVVLIIGVLSTITAPSWLAFLNRQRISKFNDAIFSAVQEAQQQAKRTKSNYSVRFRVLNSIPQFAIHPADSSPTASTWKRLGENLEVKPDQVWLGTNIDGTNRVGSLQILTTGRIITFDSRGNLPPDAQLGTNNVGLNVVVALPQQSNPSQPIPSTKRCVAVKTLLGSIQTQQAAQCP